MKISTPTAERDSGSSAHAVGARSLLRIVRLTTSCLTTSCLATSCLATSCLTMCVSLVSANSTHAMPPEATNVLVIDEPGDSGFALRVMWTVPDPTLTKQARVERSATTSERAANPDEAWIEVATVDAAAGVSGLLIDGLPKSSTDPTTTEPIAVRVGLVGTDEETAAFVESEAVVAVRNIFLIKRLGLAVALVVVCGSVIVWILLSRTGRSVKIRRIAALDAVDEAVGRATEMGRPVLFVPGIQDMTDIQTVAGITVLGRVARTAAEYDATLEVPTSRSIVMTAARETVQAAHFSAGRPETYNQGNINYITDEQFGYVAYVTGRMVRDKPAACFYMGAFYAESLLLAENGNAIGAIQIAGTAEPSQLPFFVAACDYTLIGEEFFAASAYLSGERDQLGSIKGQDLGKLFVAAAILIGCALATIAVFVPEGSVARASLSFQSFFGG